MLLPTVLVAGLLDGLNPCAFAVMAFLVAFLFGIRQARWQVLRVGAGYIVGMYLVYFGLGLGLLRVLAIPGQPHLVAKLSAGVVIALGLVQLKDGLFPRLPLHLSMPPRAFNAARTLIDRTGPLSATALGGLVGLCTVPCSGGIYLGILGLLAAEFTYPRGVAYLAAYNAMFVLPLVALLLAVVNRPTARALAAWERSHTQATHLLAGIAMLALGILVLAWTG